MANSLLETCNNWQVRRAELLVSNPDIATTVEHLDSLIERTVLSAIEIAGLLEWDIYKAKRQANAAVEADIQIQGGE